MLQVFLIPFLPFLVFHLSMPFLSGMQKYLIQWTLFFFFYIPAPHHLTFSFSGLTKAFQRHVSHFCSLSCLLFKFFLFVFGCLFVKFISFIKTLDSIMDGIIQFCVFWADSTCTQLFTFFFLYFFTRALYLSLTDLESRILYFASS